MCNHTPANIADAVTVLREAHDAAVEELAAINAPAETTERVAA